MSRPGWELVQCHDVHGGCRFCGWYLSQLQLSPSLWQARRLRVRGRQLRPGEPGYKASADYVARLMTQADYKVTIQTYKFNYYAYTALPVLSEVSPTAHDYVVSTEWNPGQSTGTANASSLQPAGGIIIPPT